MRDYWGVIVTDIPNTSEVLTRDTTGIFGIVFMRNTIFCMYCAWSPLEASIGRTIKRLCM